MKKVDVYGACMNGGDGSVHIEWFLDSNQAEKEEEEQTEGWGEPCNFHIETFIGSNIHKEAVNNQN